MVAMLREYLPQTLHFDSAHAASELQDLLPTLAEVDELFLHDPPSLEATLKRQEPQSRRDFMLLYLEMARLLRRGARQLRAASQLGLGIHEVRALSREEQDAIVEYTQLRMADVMRQDAALAAAFDQEAQEWADADVAIPPDQD